MARLLTSIVLGVLLWALPNFAFAAEGDYVSAASLQSAWGTTEVYLLCDGDHNNQEECAEFNLKAVGSNQKRTAPATVQFLIHYQATNCTPTVTVKGIMATAATGVVEHSIVALLGTGTSSYAPAVPTLFPIYMAEVGLDADCTDLEVYIILNYPKMAN